MIYIRLAGGLGNQLFQIAAAFQVQKATNQKIVLFTDSLNKYSTKRDFNIDKLLPDQFIISKPPFIINILAKYRVNKLFPFIFGWYINSNNILNIKKKKTYLLDDYFQNVITIAEGVKELSDKLLISSNNIVVNNLLNKILNNQSIQDSAAIHIRRGDYLTPVAQKVLHNLEENYYKKAIDLLPNHIKTLIIFTDSITEDLSFIKNKQIIYVRDFNLTDWQELLLMSNLSNIIIANSTFSFWAANISKKDKGIKIGPKNWFHNQKDNFIWNNNLQKSGFILV